MNDEIKEILDIFDEKIRFYEFDKKFGQLSVDSIAHLFPNEMIILKDYITNLQQENERLNTELNAYKDEFCKDTIKEHELVMELEYYKSNCEKAIDFVKKESKKCYSNQINDNPTKVIGNFMWHTDKLLNILNGGDE